MAVKHITNADRIRKMTDEELADLLNKAVFCGGLISAEESSIQCHGCKLPFCAGVEKWLRTEYLGNTTRNC